MAVRPGIKPGRLGIKPKISRFGRAKYPNRGGATSSAYWLIEFLLANSQLFVIFKSTIVIKYFMSWAELSAIGTILVAAVAVIVALLPYIVHCYNKPKFYFKLRSEGKPPSELQTILLEVENRGRGIAHKVKGFTKVEDKNRKTILPGQIPILSNYESYKFFDLYPCERASFEIILYTKFNSNTNYYWGITTYPYRRNKNYPPKIDGRNTNETEYNITVYVGCEELSKPASYSLVFKKEADKWVVHSKDGDFQVG
ncbi:MAG: hypothetical protein JRN10_00235 [Nitrososphaerota archaeon]|nr:hypothetical protein [Nitrososphaerota archaeon]MDG6929665.1 hypothetical protein [Nitrososphaerota archaeon]